MSTNPFLEEEYEDHEVGSHRKRQHKYRGSSRSSRPRLARSTQNGSQNGSHKYPRFRADLSEDVELVEVGSLPPSQTKNHVIGIDFGTTFSSVSHFSYLNEDEKAGVRASDIKKIVNWPEDTIGNGRSEQVPMAIWYPSEPIRRDPVRGVQFDREAKADIVASQLKSGLFDPRAAMKQSKPWKDNDDRLEDVQFGYQALWNRYNVKSNRDVDCLVQGAKSMLFKTPHSKQDREKLQAQLNSLIERGIIRKYGNRREPDVRDVRDVITDLFVKLLQHTKQQLIAREGFNDKCSVQWELAIPTIWNPMSSELLKVALEDAICFTGFGVQKGCINLSTGTEPEFAIHWIMEKCPIPLDGKITTVFDLGGGTCDAATFRISKKDDVLSLGKPIVDPNGCASGGIYANKNYRDLLAHRLRDESYLGEAGDSLNDIIDRLIPEFETQHKRRFDMIKNPPTGAHGLRINGLRGDKQMGRTGDEVKRFDDSYLIMDSSDYRKIFEPLLTKMWPILGEQLEAVKESGTGQLVENVVLVGGFSAAPSVRSFIKLNLASYAKDVTRELGLRNPYKINFIEDTEKCVAAVASGGVLRGLNKQVGPDRIAQLSYGLLQSEYYDPLHFPEHKKGIPIADPRGGSHTDKFIHCINYFIKKNKPIEPLHRYRLGYPLTHTILVRELENEGEPYFCEEIIYVTDRPPVSHYPLTYERNMSANEAHRILIDMTFLREERKCIGITGQQYCDVKYDLLLWVDGKTLKYEVRYPRVPAGDDPFEGQGKVKAKGDFCITAAFLPGTA